MLEQYIGQQASAALRQPDSVLGKSKFNPKEQCNLIGLTYGKNNMNRECDKEEKEVCEILEEVSEENEKKDEESESESEIERKENESEESIQLICEKFREDRINEDKKESENQKEEKIEGEEVVEVTCEKCRQYKIKREEKACLDVKKEVDLVCHKDEK